VPPLDGVRVIDLTRLLPGAYATQLLVDLGAQVVKVEDPNGGDGMRRFGEAFDRVNRGKQSVTLDLRSADAMPVLHALLARADVVIHSFRPSTAARLRVDGDTLRAAHPRLICASITGFGLTGPRAEMAAHDINYRALAGQLAGAKRPGPLIADIGAAMHATIKILAALIERDRMGVGSVLDAPIFDAAREWTSFPETDDFESACYSLYEAADGEWLALGALEPKFWRRFCERLDHREWIPRQRERDIPELRALMRTRSRDEWLALFEGVDVCLTPVVNETDGGVSGFRRTAAAPALGADTDTVLASCGIAANDRARLRASRVI